MKLPSCIKLAFHFLSLVHLLVLMLNYSLMNGYECCEDYIYSILLSFIMQSVERPADILKYKRL